MIGRLLHSPALADRRPRRAARHDLRRRPALPDRRPRVGGAHRQPHLQLLRGDGRRPARGAEPRRPGREALDDRRPAARPRRAADLRPRRQRGRARRGGRDLHARPARADRGIGAPPARTRPRTPRTAGRTSATSAGSTTDGYLHVTGRVKDTIIRGGSNINPFEVEDVLRGSAAVQDVCVVGRPDEDLGERAVAFVVPAPGSEPTLEELTAHLEEAGLTRYKWPETLHLLDALPHGATGKVDRKGLRERAKAMTAARYEVGRGEPVVLVHGLADDHRAWRRVVAPLMLTRRVVLYDLRGHGGSPLGDADGSLAQLGADLIERARRRRDRPRDHRRLLARRHDRHARRHRRARSRRPRSPSSAPRAASTAPPAAGTRSAPRSSKTTTPSCARRSTATPRTSTATALTRSRPGCGSAASRPPTRAASPTPASPWRASTRPRSIPSWARSPCRPCSLPAMPTSTARRAHPRSSPRRSPSSTMQVLEDTGHPLPVERPDEVAAAIEELSA